MSMSSLPAVAQQELNARRKLKRCRGELDEEDMKDEKKEEKKESKEAKEVKKEEKKKVASLDDVQDLDMEVTLKSSNDKEHGFVVTRRQACISSLLKTSLENGLFFFFCLLCCAISFFLLSMLIFKDICKK